MSAEVQSIVQSALLLAPADRIALAEKILESLDQADQATVDASWVQESEDRLAAFDRGELQGIPFDEAMHDLRQDTST